VPAAHRAGALGEAWRASRSTEWMTRPERVSAKVLTEFTPG
jgi:hypothetical protein